MNRKNFHKNLLTKASIISLVTAMSNYNTVLAASDVPAPEGAVIMQDARLTDTIDMNNWQQIDQRGEVIKDTKVDTLTNKAITYRGDHTLVADVDGAAIPAINLGGNSVKAMRIEENTTIGSILNGTLPVIINQDKTLTLIGSAATEDKHGFKAGENIYTGVGPITVKGNLIINPMVHVTASGSEVKIKLTGNITSPADNRGTLTFLGASQIEQDIASSDAPLDKVIFDTTQQVDLSKNVYAANTYITNTGILNVGGTLFSNIIFSVPPLDVRDVINVKDKVGRVNIADGHKIVGNISSQGDANGEIIFLGAGGIESGVVRDLGKLIVGKGDVTLSSGFHKINEIQGNGTNTLSFDPGVTLEGSINSTAGQALNLVLSGGAINHIKGIVGSRANPVGDIQVQQGTHIFDDKVNADNIIIGNGATTIFNNSITAKNIRGADNNSGTVKFNNNNNLVVNSKIGDINQINTIEIANEDVEVNEQFAVGRILFSSDKEATLTLSKAAVITEGVTTNSNNQHTLVLAQDFDTLGVPFGSNTNRLKTIRLQNDKQITINSNEFYSSISTAADNTGKAIVNSEGSFAYTLGSSNFKLSEVNFESNFEVKGDVYSNITQVAEGKTVTFAGTESRLQEIAAPSVNGVAVARTSEPFNFNTVIESPLGLNLAPDSTIHFATSTWVKSPINNGHINCTSDTWFQKEINHATQLTFASEKLTILERDIAANNITGDKAHIIVMNPITISGNWQAPNLTLDLGTNTVRYAGDAVLAGECKINIFYDSSTLAGGNIRVQEGATMDLSGVAQLFVKVTAQSNINDLPHGILHPLIVKANGDVTALPKDKITLDIIEANEFVSWEIDPDTLTLSAKDISHVVLPRVARRAPPYQAQFITQLISAEPNSDAGKLKNSLGFMDADTQDTTLKKLHDPAMPIGQETLINTTTEITEEGVLQTSNHTTLRMATSQKRAIGAGDAESRQYGIWGSPLYGYATQKMQEGVSGYKLKSLGAIVGIDTFINDNLLIGAAYSRLNTKMAYKNQKAGDKTKGKINFFSLYSAYSFSSNWLLEGMFSYGKTQVKNLEGRVMATGAHKTVRETAMGKYKTTYYGGKLLVGYNYQARDKLVLTPLVGLRYSRFADSGYQEAGTSFGNFTHQKRTYNKLESLVGIRALTSVELKDITLIPEFHGYFNYAFKRKSPLVTARLAGIEQPLASKIITPNRRYYNLGTSLTAKYKVIEYGIAYNADLAKKYIAHQGSLKLRVNL